MHDDGDFHDESDAAPDLDQLLRDPAFEGVPEPIVELCEACVRYVQRAIGLQVDYQPETLSLVDHYVHQTRQTLAGRPEALPLVAQAVGAYFGEVARRALNGFWRLPSGNQADWQLCGHAAFVALNPIGVGYDAVASGEEHDGPRSTFRVAPEDRELVHARLEALPPVGEEEFYTLCTRLEVLEITMEAVIGQQSARGYDELEFGPDDYESELRPLGFL